MDLSAAELGGAETPDPSAAPVSEGQIQETRKMKQVAVLAAILGLTVMACESPLPAHSTASGVHAEEQAGPPTDPALIGEVRPGSGYLAGYLAAVDLPDSAALLPQPPVDGTAKALADLETYKATRAYRETDRWRLAQQDNELRFPEAATSFACILGMEISEEQSPHLTTLMRRTLADAGRSTYKAKEQYQRTRPFALLGDPSCVPEAEEMLAGDGSYPSGHAALGWAWGLVLAAIAPDQADLLLQRGYEFGESRVVCGVHWLSDVEAGRLMGAATFSRLQSEPVFRAQSELARDEIKRAKSIPTAPAHCIN